MNNLNQKFSFSRYWILLKCYLVENRKSLLTLSGLIIGVLVLVSAKQVMTLHISPFGTVISLLMVFACLSGANMFSVLKGRQSRIRFMLLPASITEKFAMCLTVYVLLFYVVYLIGWALADLVFVAVCDVNVLCVFRLNGNASLIYIMLVLFMQSIFALGSALWPKRSFAKTFFALFVILLIFMFENFTGRLLMKIDSETSVILTLLCLTLACYSLAWWRFRNVQITQQFMR